MAKRTRSRTRSSQSQLSAQSPFITQVLHLEHEAARLGEAAGGIRLNLLGKMSVQGKLQSRQSKKKYHADKEDAFKWILEKSDY